MHKGKLSNVFFFFELTFLQDGIYFGCRGQVSHRRAVSAADL